MKINRILIVDDNEENLYLLRTLLQGNGYDVVAADNGSDALDKARNNPPDLIIADILMPIMDGFALCREWKLDNRLRSVPFVLYTATYTDPQDEAFALDIGVDRFITKPCEPDVLMEAIREVIAAAKHDNIVSAPELQGEEEVLRLYNKRLVQKLEQKMMQLETEVWARRETETALKESEEKHRMLFETANDAILLMRRNRFIDCNARTLTMFGCRREQIVDALPYEYSPPTQPDGRSSEDKALEKINLALTDGPQFFEWEHCRLDKTLFTAEVSLNALQLGGETLLQAIVRDITARKRTETALKESMEYLNRILNCIGDPVFVKDANHEIVLVNDAMCAFTGKRRDELLENTAYKYFSEEAATSSWEREEDILKNGRESVAEEDIPDRQGHTRTMMSKKTLLMNKSGNKQIVSVLRDITEYKRLQTQFLQAQKMEAIGVLAGGVAHDFNNLLFVIKGYVEILMEKLAPDDSKRAELEQIANAGQQAISLTAQLLAFSRKQILQPKIINMNDVIGEVGKMLRRLIGEDIELITIAHPKLKLVNADPSQIHQIIMNLAVNARDAMPLGGKVTIETANVDLEDELVQAHPQMGTSPYVMLAISDNGMGMDAATQARIFEPFFTTKGRGKGTGLGLSTVYGIVKQSNGFIWVHSELGKGATFKIYLPCVDGEIAEITDENKSEPAPRGFETLLLVEDDESVRTLAGRILRRQGYNLLEAADGIKALRLAQEFSGDIHLVITDVVMPGMSGSEMVSQLEAARPGIKSLYISGYTDDTIVYHGILDSNVVFLQKPFTIERLLYKVRETIDSY
jgi:PAS domain S-box-containing protein